MNARDLIYRLGLTPTYLHPDAQHADLWDGSNGELAPRNIGDGYYALTNVLEGAQEVEAWCDYPDHVVWRLPLDQAIVTYDRGAVSVLIARSASDYTAIVRSARRMHADTRLWG